MVPKNVELRDYAVTRMVLYVQFYPDKLTYYLPHRGFTPWSLYSILFPKYQGNQSNFLKKFPGSHKPSKANKPYFITTHIDKNVNLVPGRNSSLKEILSKTHAV